MKRIVLLLAALVVTGCTGAEPDPVEPQSEFQRRGSSDAIRKVLRQNEGQVQACYESRRRENPSLDGRVEVGVKVEDGKVTGVEVVENTTRDDALASCIRTRVRTWRFEPGTTGELQLPFALTAG